MLSLGQRRLQVMVRVSVVLQRVHVAWKGAQPNKMLPFLHVFPVVGRRISQLSGAAAVRPSGVGSSLCIYLGTHYNSRP